MRIMIPKMPNNEAIEQIKKILKHEKLSAESIMALDIAIESLESQPCEDCISREETLKAFAEKCNGECGCCVYNGSGYDTAENCKLIKSMPSVTPKAGWIPIKTRPMTEEEKEYFFEYAGSRCDDTYTMLDCPLPDDGQEVILSVNGYVSTDTFCSDSAYGCYFESYDIDEVKAWMPLPEPYKAESEDKE